MSALPVSGRSARHLHAGTEVRAPGLVVNVLLADGTALLRLDGDLDAASAPDLIEVGRTLAADGSEHLLIDCGRLAFCDSAGLHAFVSILRAPGTKGVQLVRTSADLRRLLEIGGLDTCLLPPPADGPRPRQGGQPAGSAA